MKERTKTVSNWKELIDFVNGVNVYKKTIVLVGYINKRCNNTLKIKKLVFSTKDIDILREYNEDGKNKESNT